MPRFKIQDVVVTELESTEKGPQFLATGTLRDLVAKSKTKPFVAKTIIWQGEPIFKVQDAGSLKDRKWKRGERIAIARVCKRARLERNALEADGYEPDELDLDFELEAAA
jgi:hypothetical protein